MNDNDLITRREVELALLEKGQKSKRYKLGEIWELNFDEIREALSGYQPKIVRCKECKRKDTLSCPKAPVRPDDWFCADGKRR